MSKALCYELLFLSFINCVYNAEQLLRKVCFLLECYEILVYGTNAQIDVFSHSVPSSK